MNKRIYEPIKRTTLSAVVTERLRELVVSGTYLAGMQLSEVDLAERFGVSRGPIREALQRLVQEGLLRSEPHRGVFVPSVDAVDAADIYLAREAIESAASRVIAADPRRGATIGRLRDVLDQLSSAAAADRWDRVAELDLRFHTDLVAATGSPRLVRMYATLIDETRILLALQSGRPGRVSIAGEHLALLAAIEAGDGDAAVTAVERHFHGNVERGTDGATVIAEPAPA